MLGVDAVITKVQKIVLQSRAMLKSAPSLRPGESMMNGCIAGNPEALAIRDIWAFRESRATKIKVVSSSEFAAMVDRQVVFIG